jgi:nitroreductase
MSTSAPTRGQQALVEASSHALLAPSIFNTQPWRWRVTGDRLELHADRRRQLESNDPDGRMLTLSCGAALHHARVALAAAGYEPEVTRLPDLTEPDLLAVLRCGARREPDPATLRLKAAIARRRTDRRAYADAPVPPLALRALRDAVERADAYLHLVRTDQLPLLAIAAGEAGVAQSADPAYRAELSRWTHRPSGSGDGVPPGTAVRPGPRRMPTRDFAPDGRAGLDAGAGTDRGAAFAVLFGSSDDPAGWLRGGEALSALLLTATDAGLAAAPMSDLVEVSWSRQILRQLLSGIGEPYLVVRIGIAERAAEPAGANPGTPPAEPPASPRRSPADVVTGPHVSAPQVAGSQVTGPQVTGSQVAGSQVTGPDAGQPAADSDRAVR